MVSAAGAKTSQDAGDLPLHPKLAALFDALDAEEISWCLLRGGTDLWAPAGDVDLLVARSDFPRMRRVAASLDFARIPAWGYGSHAFFLTYHSSTDVWIKLDVVTELAFGPAFSLATGAETECLARQRRVAGVPMPSEADEFWTLLLHELLDKEWLGAPSHAARLTELAPRAGQYGSLRAIVDMLSPAGWSAARIIDAAERGDWAALRDLAPSLATSWRRHWWIDVRHRAIASHFWRACGKWLRLIYRRGLSVALLGPDGAGKSTLAAGIESSFYFPVRSLYMGLYRTPSRRLSPRHLPGVSLAIRLGRQWMRMLKAAYHRRRGRLVLFDRYSYDAMLPRRVRHTRRSGTRRWLLAHACPRPDLVVVLDAPGELLHARKGEHDVAFLEREREAFRALVPRLPRALLVDASRDADLVCREVTAAIWCEYVRRWNARDERR